MNAPDEKSLPRCSISEADCSGFKVQRYFKLIVGWAEKRSGETHAAEQRREIALDFASLA